MSDRKDTPHNPPSDDQASSNPDTGSSPQPESAQPEKVGDILHKERVTRRIALETIAKDLKLNLSYIKAIESNNFELIPAEPYVRVYIRSIASYLMLDPDAMLEKFYKDRGIKKGDSIDHEPEKIQINVEKDNNQKPSVSWKIILLIFIAGIVVIFIASKMNWIKVGTDGQNITPTASRDAIDTLYKKATDLSDSLTDTTTDTTLQDSLINTNTDDTTKKAEQYETLNQYVPKDSIKFVIKGMQDSVWVHLFSDGKSWRNHVRKDQTKVFFAKDSFNVHVGENTRLTYFFNGKKITISGKGIKFFKLDKKNGLKIWTTAQWNAVFGKTDLDIN